MVLVQVLDEIVHVVELAGLAEEPVDPRSFAAAWDEASAAVLVASQRRPELRAVLDRFDETAIVRAQATRLAD